HRQAHGAAAHPARERRRVGPAEPRAVVPTPHDRRGHRSPARPAGHARGQPLRLRRRDARGGVRRPGGVDRARRPPPGRGRARVGPLAHRAQVHPRPASGRSARAPEVVVPIVTRRVIFLDFDGVLAPITRWDRYGDLDPSCVELLNEIVAAGDADVVVSSTWRYGKTVAELQAMLDAQGFKGSVRDKTPTVDGGATRGDEIAAWLAVHDVSGYVIIDDHPDVGALQARLVLTHPARGLQPADAVLAIETLMRSTNGAPA